MFDFDALPEENTPISRPCSSELDTPSEPSFGQSESNGFDSDASTTDTSSTRRDAFVQFDKGFVFGVATSAYQIEGAANHDGRTPSTWDQFSHTPGKTVGGDTGDIACDHYHRFRTDVGIMAKLGIKAYRFSISWSRLIPDGNGYVNPAGVQFYSDLIDELLRNGIQPWVTLYHWDLPLCLERRYGGWLCPSKEMVRVFGVFARACFKHFGDRVTKWMTVNEPYCTATMGYMDGTQPPGNISNPSREPYIVAHNLLLAHAEAVRIYRTEFNSQGGSIGIVLNINYRKAFDSSSELDTRAAQRCMDFEFGWFADPVFHGDYPERMRKTCGDRLPSFTARERRLLKGSSDFLGVNYYYATFAAALPERINRRRKSGGVNPGLSWYDDLGVQMKKDPGWEKTDMGWFVTPWALHEVLMYVHHRYKPQHGIIITENGCAHEPMQTAILDALEGALKPREYNPEAPPTEDFDGETYEDPQRVRFIRQHLLSVQKAIDFGADVQGYFVWSLLDNFEWAEGYAKRFGIVRVDYSTQKRTIKASGRFYADVIADGGFHIPEATDTYSASYRRPSVPGYS